ncbi:hypothetical protein D6D01_08191 [Aureobasidium pullulans]|uniref:Uncharacterized protein n=1 Tax=Aureobasidium pullulans TaxID=5580 RepID=A0A4S9KG02_AURPU|nr:hypothetical protein D6D01_08191 [Aureobasidium pullulans]
MRSSLITAFLAFATSTLAIAIPSPTSVIGFPSSSSSILRSAHLKETNSYTAKSEEECKEIFHPCEKEGLFSRKNPWKHSLSISCETKLYWETLGFCFPEHVYRYGEHQSTPSSSSTSFSSPSSLIQRSAPPKQTDDNDKPGKSAHECDEILEECKKGARTERFCQEYTCYKTKGACYSGHCDTYRRARRALAGGVGYDEQSINDLAISKPTPTTSATKNPSASKARGLDVDEDYTPRPEDLDDDCRRTEDSLKQFKWNDEEVYTPKPEDLDDDRRRMNDLLKQSEWNDSEEKDRN